jgi:hypothetical protein
MSDESGEEKRTADPKESSSRPKTKAGGYRDLLVRQKAVTLVKSIYQITRHFPQEGRFGPVSQMRRAAVSIPSNIAEGQARRTTAEFIQCLS